MDRCDQIIQMTRWHQLGRSKKKVWNIQKQNKKNGRQPDSYFYLQPILICILIYIYIIYHISYIIYIYPSQVHHPLKAIQYYKNTPIFTPQKPRAKPRNLACGGVYLVICPRLVRSHVSSSWQLQMPWRLKQRQPGPGPKIFKEIHPRLKSVWVGKF